MSRKKPFAAFALAVVIISGCGGSGDGEATRSEPEGPMAYPITEALLAQGQHTYKLNCVPCHGPQGKGDGPSAEGLNPRPRDHSNSEYMSRLTDDMIAEAVKMGGVIRGYPNMPSSPHIKGDEMIALIAFVRSLHDADREKVELTMSKFQ